MIKMVAVPRHRLILRRNEATASKNTVRTPPKPIEAMCCLKTLQNNSKIWESTNYIILFLLSPIDP